MNSIFTFDNFRFASYLRIAFISYEYGLLLWFDRHLFQKAVKIFVYVLSRDYVEAPVSALANKDKL